MKQLIISDYDMECEFQAKVLVDGEEIENYEESKELVKYNLYDSNDNWFTEELITEANEKIKEFDMIICCVDGTIFIYRKGEQY